MGFPRSRTLCAHVRRQNRGRICGVSIQRGADLLLRYVKLSKNMQSRSFLHATAEWAQIDMVQIALFGDFHKIWVFEGIVNRFLTEFHFGEFIFIEN